MDVPARFTEWMETTTIIYIKILTFQDKIEHITTAVLKLAL